jgi:integrase
VSALVAEIPPRPETPRGVEPVLRRADDGGWTYRYRTRWTDPITGKRPPAEFDTLAEVLDFRAFLRQARARGEVAQLTRGDRTIAQFVDRVWWPRYAKRRLARNTLAPYRSVYRNHLHPYVGSLKLRHLNAERVRDLRDALLDAGVGAPTVRRAMVLLQGICTDAVEAGALQFNPVRDIRKPAIKRKLSIQAPGPAQIEALIAGLDAAGAALVALIGYEGLRPSEALALEERHLMRSTILVEQHLDHGQVVIGLKNSGGRERSNRSPTLYTPVRETIDRHLADRGRAGRRQLLFPGEHGKPWTPYEYRRWRETQFAPAVERAGIDLGRPYDLRHGCASMLLHAQRPLGEISKHMGHTVATLSAYYSHLIEDLRDQDPVDVEQQIHGARTSREETS